MATKKKSKKAGAHHKRRRKVGAHGELTGFLIRVAAVGAGGLAAAFAIQAGNTMMSSQQMPMWVVPGAVAAAGGTLGLIDKKNEALKDFGLGMVAVGTAFAVNELGLSVPGISGLAMSSNAPINANVLRGAVGCKVGAGPNNYLNSTVGSRRSQKLQAVGALMTN